MKKTNGEDTRGTLYCSFCGKGQHEVRKLIAGPSVFICDECIDLCTDIIKEEGKGPFVRSFDDVPSPKQIFDVIVINPPYFFKHVLNPSQYAWYCGNEGEFFVSLFSQLINYVNILQIQKIRM